jgi:hypothetical protein
MGVFPSDLDAPAADEARTSEDGRAALATEGGPSNVLVVPRAHAPVLVTSVNVPAEGRDLEVRVGRGGVVEGRVLDADGSGVAGASVALWARPLYRREATTDAGGRFRFPAVAGPGPSRWPDPRPEAGLLARAAGWARGVATFAAPKAGETLAVEVRLRRARTLRVRVLHADGRPAAGASVRVEEETELAPSFGSDAEIRGTTDAEGRFEAPGFPGGARASVWVEWGDPSLDAASAFDVPEGNDPAPVEVRLPDRTGRVVVLVTDARGAPVAGAGLEDAGRASLGGLPRDRATLKVRAPASVAVARDLDAAALAGGEVRVVLEGGRITGVARRGDGAPAARARLVLEREIGGSIERGAPAVADEDGAFAFGHLPEGMFRLDAEDPALRLVATLPWAATGSTDEAVWLVGVEEAAAFHFEVVLVEDATGTPIALADGVNAEFHPASGTPGPRFSWSVGGGGPEPGRHVSPLPVPPGTYDVVIRAGGFRSGRLPGVRIPRTGAPPVLRLDRGLRLVGRVTLPDGRPVAGARVDVGSQCATTGPDGAYAVDGLEAGEFEARLFGDPVVEERRRVEVAPQGPRRLDWRAVEAGAVQVVLSESPVEAGAERVRVTPLARGEPQERGSEGPLSHGGPEHGARFGGLLPGTWRVEAWQGATAWPAQEVEVRAGAVAVVRFPAEASPPR